MPASNAASQDDYASEQCRQPLEHKEGRGRRGGGGGEDKAYLGRGDIRKRAKILLRGVLIGPAVLVQLALSNQLLLLLCHRSKSPPVQSASSAHAC